MEKRFHSYLLEEIRALALILRPENRQFEVYENK